MLTTLKKANVIKQRVLEVIHKRIDDGQVKYDVEVKQLEEQHYAEMDRLESKLRHNKMATADRVVEDIIGKA